MKTVIIALIALTINIVALVIVAEKMSVETAKSFETAQVSYR